MGFKIEEPEDWCSAAVLYLDATKPKNKRPKLKWWWDWVIENRIITPNSDTLRAFETSLRKRNVKMQRGPRRGLRHYTSATIKRAVGQVKALLKYAVEKSWLN
jgi:hypothetical protein